MTDNEPKVGSIVDSICTKCKLVLDHVVVSMRANNLDKVKCNTCNAIHKYKDPEKKSVTRKTGARKAASIKTKLTISEKEWESILKDIPTEEFLPYSMDKKFKKGDKIKHPSFGDGSVIGVVGVNKINVLFTDGHRLLICNKSKEA